MPGIYGICQVAFAQENPCDALQRANEWAWAMVASLPLGDEWRRWLRLTEQIHASWMAANAAMVSGRFK